MENVEKHREELRSDLLPLQREVESLRQGLANFGISHVGGTPDASRRRGPAQGVDPTNLFIKNIPHSYSEELLRDLFQKYGEITSCRIMVNKKTGQSLGFGFVRYAAPHSAQAAISAMNGVELDGSILLCKLAQLSNKPEEVAAVPTNNLYVKPLLKTITEDDLTAFFSTFGSVVSTKVVRDKEGQSLESGLVRFETVAEADDAVHKASGMVTSLHPMPLIVRYAETQSQKQQRWGVKPGEFPPAPRGERGSFGRSDSDSRPSRDMAERDERRRQRFGFSLKVSNLPERADDYLLYELFKCQFDDVVTARVITDRQTGQSLGYGFVTFAKEESLSPAVDFYNHRDCEGSVLEVAIAH